MSDILKIVISFLGGGGIVALVIIWGLNNIEKVEKIFSWFYRFFGWAAQKFEYGKVAYDIQSTINTFGEKINTEVPGILPHAMKIDWIKDKTVEASLRNGNIIVMMDYSRNQEKNLVVSTLVPCNILIFV